MSKRPYENGSSKRKKATAKADALRAVTEKTKLITQFFGVLEGPREDLGPMAMEDLWTMVAFS